MDCTYKLPIYASLDTGRSLKEDEISFPSLVTNNEARIEAWPLTKINSIRAESFSGKNDTMFYSHGGLLERVHYIRCCFLG